RIGEAFLGEVEQRQVAALLRGAEAGQTHMARAARELRNERHQGVLVAERRRRGGKGRTFQRDVPQCGIGGGNRGGLLIVRRRALRGGGSGEQEQAKEGGENALHLDENVVRSAMTQLRPPRRPPSPTTTPTGSCNRPANP